MDFPVALSVRFDRNGPGHRDAKTQQCAEDAHAQPDEARRKLQVSRIQRLALAHPHQPNYRSDANRQRDRQEEHDARNPGGDTCDDTPLAELESPFDQSDQSNDNQADF
jgi:hypothetical protein